MSILSTVVPGRLSKQPVVYHLLFIIEMSKPSDPVAEKSGFLRMYMSGHPDTLVAYAKWYGKVQEAITSAEMIAIDTKVRATSSTPEIIPSFLILCFRV